VNPRQNTAECGRVQRWSDGGFSSGRRARRCHGPAAGPTSARAWPARSILRRVVQVLDRLTELRDVPAELVLAALGTAESPEHARWRALPRRAMLAADVGAAEHSLDHGDLGQAWLTQ